MDFTYDRVTRMCRVEFNAGETEQQWQIVARYLGYVAGGNGEVKVMTTDPQDKEKKLPFPVAEFQLGDDVMGVAELENVLYRGQQAAQLKSV